MNSQTWPIQAINIISVLTDLVFSDQTVSRDSPRGTARAFSLFPFTSSRDAEVM